ncbi:hypothetical protein DFH09DRAFT_1333765 [Mycena vulgaris]|nr:hypothetical protein DFH09DRAFT_1333765 [Mycena vulgaris]
MSEAPAAPPAYTRHPVYWANETRTFVYAVQGVLYHFPLAVLTMMSPPLTSIFGIPQSTATTADNVTVMAAEGTEANPIVLPGVTVQQFDDLLSYFFKSALIPMEMLSTSRKQEVCINLLSVGSLWEIDEAKQYAKDVLRGMNLPAERILQIARQFAIHEWIDDAVRTLIPNCGSLNNTQALILGPITLNILYQAKTELAAECMLVAHVAPTLTSADYMAYGACRDHKSCERGVKTHWWTLVGKKFLHPKNPMALGAIGTHLSKIVFPGMTPKCQEDMVFQWTTNVFQQEDIVQAAVEAVVKFNQCYRLA